jgi:hypothetical protein
VCHDNTIYYILSMRYFGCLLDCDGVEISVAHNSFNLLKTIRCNINYSTINPSDSYI